MTPILAAATAFNLVCSGTMTQTGKAPEPFNRTIRVDLVKRKYCEDDCRFIRDIYEVQPTVIRLKSERVDSRYERTRDDETVSRETGRYLALYLSGSFMINREGHCERSEFTGFPEFKTKF